MEELYHKGIMALWLGPTYPLVLIYKPELVEVGGNLCCGWWVVESVQRHSARFVNMTTALALALALAMLSDLNWPLLESRRVICNIGKFCN